MSHTWTLMHVNVNTNTRGLCRPHGYKSAGTWLCHMYVCLPATCCGRTREEWQICLPWRSWCLSTTTIRIRTVPSPPKLPQATRLWSRLPLTPHPWPPRVCPPSLQFCSFEAALSGDSHSCRILRLASSAPRKAVAIHPHCCCFLFPAGDRSTARRYHSWFNHHPLKDIQLFPIWVMTNKGAMNTCVQVFAHMSLGFTWVNS